MKEETIPEAAATPLGWGYKEMGIIKAWKFEGRTLWSSDLHVTSLC